MNTFAGALNNLYRRGKVTRNGLKQAVADGIITTAEYENITNEQYA